MLAKIQTKLHVPNVKIGLYTVQWSLQRLQWPCQIFYDNIPG